MNDLATLILGALAGAAVLGGLAWWLSEREWKRNDVADDADAARSLAELQARRDRR
jgi:hypothetical protein